MRALVTGGGGFLGRRIVELLLVEGHEVHLLARSRYPEVEALGAVGHALDLRERERLPAVLAGMEVVIHAAGKAGSWGDPAEYRAINVDGTRNLLDAVRAAGVPRLVYTSTPSVIGYEQDAAGIAEAPYAARHLSPYPASKAEAERLVLEANGPTLATVALRPHLIMGAGDPHMLPRVVHRARQGRLAVVGDGQNRVDLTCLDNAAWAHLDAVRALTDHRAPCAGRAYFISNGEPVLLWDWLGALVVRLGAPPIRRRVSYGFARRLGYALEWMWRLLPLPDEPPLTRFLADALARSHWYDMGPASRDLGYRVRVSLADGTEGIVAGFRASGRDA